MMSNIKSHDNTSIKCLIKQQRMRNIETYLNIFLPKDVIEIICGYDYYLEGTSYTFKDYIKYLRRIISISVLSDGRIMGASSSGQHKILNPQTGKCDLNFNGTDNFIQYSLVLSDGRLVSAVYNKIKIWNPQTKICDVICNGHTDGVVCLALLSDRHIKKSSLLNDEKDVDEHLVSGSHDTTIKIWNIRTGKCDITLEGHTRWIWCIKILSDGRIASGSADRTIKIWNLQTGKCDITLKGHMDFIFCIDELPDRRIVSGSGDGIIKIWNMNESSNFLGRCDVTFIKYNLSYKYH
ncbi:MAG TPA: WD40 repeat domain-containing protein, partial [Aquella sp.]|nr:WD40 repeat domain-containing protein [Aquella sp.]